MARKNFNQGLEDIFLNAAAESDTEMLSPRSERSFNKVEESSSTLSATKKTKKSYRKSFTVDLNNLLEDAMAESKSGQATSETPEKSNRLAPKKRIKKVPLTGINALIRRTIDVDYDSERGYETKRVTFLCDKDKIARLKKIAKSEKTYLKDILNELIDKYIQNFDVKI